MTDWESIVRDHGPAVWRTAHRLLGNRADADECFQETFADAVEFTRRKIAPVREWRALLVRLSTARAVDRLRQRIRRTSQEISGDVIGYLSDPHLDSRPTDRAEQAEMSARLRVALTHLPPKQADAFCLHCLEGWSYREVADQMNESADHVGVLIHRARAALKAQLAIVLLDEAKAGAGESNKVSHE